MKVRPLAKYRQITDELRALIQRGDLEPGTRLPSLKTLAARWDTNYFTVHSAIVPLANEGLIERRPRKGLFIRSHRTKLISVAIYYGSDIWAHQEDLFYQRICHTLQVLLRERGIEPHVFIDPRPVKDQLSPPHALAKAIDRREIHGVIGLMLNGVNVDWLRKLPTPSSLFTLPGITMKGETAQGLALARLARDGCKTVGHIGAFFDDVRFDSFQQAAREHGMETRPEWHRSCSLEANPHLRNCSGEQRGYHVFKALWSLPERPEGIYVAPDWPSRGMITAALELGVRIPEDVRLVLYRNTGLEYPCPWRIPAVTLDVQKAAKHLVDYLEALHRGEAADPARYSIPPEITEIGGPEPVFLSSLPGAVHPLEELSALPVEVSNPS